MTIAKSRKICLAILGLAVVAFLVDRFVLSSSVTGPNQAVAAADPGGITPAALGDVTSPASLEGEGPSSSMTALAERLESLAQGRALDPANVRDALAPTDPWLSELTAAPPASAAAKEPAAAPSVQDYPKNHHLTMVLLLGDGGTAVVNGRAIKVGQQLDGYRLISVTANSATFESGDKRAELRLRPDAEQH